MLMVMLKVKAFVVACFAYLILSLTLYKYH